MFKIIHGECILQIQAAVLYATQLIEKLSIIKNIIICL